jgi:hypothetical protein
MEFKVVQTANCPEGWEEFSNYSWPGNVEGCSCTVKIGLFEYDAVMQVVVCRGREDAISGSSQEGASQCLRMQPFSSNFGNKTPTSA